MKKLRASYSLLSAFERGQLDQCVAMYQHLKTPTNQGMRDGLLQHKAWQDIIQKQGQLTIGKTEFTFKKPQCERKAYVPYSEYCDLSVVFDCLDAPVLYEWKTGTSTNAMEYATKEQVPMYFLALDLMGIQVDYCVVAHWNEVLEEADIAIRHNTKQARDEARNFIDTLAPEVYQYFESLNIL